MKIILGAPVIQLLLTSLVIVSTYNDSLVVFANTMSPKSKGGKKMGGKKTCPAECDGTEYTFTVISSGDPDPPNGAVLADMVITCVDTGSPGSVVPGISVTSGSCTVADSSANIFCSRDPTCSGVIAATVCCPSDNPCLIFSGALKDGDGDFAVTVQVPDEENLLIEEVSQNFACTGADASGTLCTLTGDEQATGLIIFCPPVPPY